MDANASYPQKLKVTHYRYRINFIPVKVSTFPVRAVPYRQAVSNSIPENPNALSPCIHTTGSRDL